MKNSLFERFKPKENKFYLLLTEMSGVVVSAADLIVQAVQQASHQDHVIYYNLVKEEELKGDRIQEKIFNELNDTFITPFDREDINTLSSRLDDITDFINSCAKRIMLYNPKSIPESALKLALIVKESALTVSLAISELSIMKQNPDKIKQYCSSLSELENKADDVYEHFLIDLFENEKDPFEVIKLKDILHELERATDAAEAVGKIIKTIVIKYT